MQSRALLQVYNADARMGSVFATQQRWLLAHAALALYFEGERGERGVGVTPARFFELVAREKIASRNTADAFLKEMVRYGLIQQVDGTDRRTHPLIPAESTVGAVKGWLAVHLSTLDQIDNGGRLTRFLGANHAIGRLHPAIARGLLASAAVRQPQKTFSLFTWLDNGGIIMEWLISSLGNPTGDSSRISAGVFSLTEMARWLKLSRTHLSRKLRDAEALNSLGWEGPRGRSAMWVSTDFVKEMLVAQATKLAIIDAAFAATLGQAE